jgi:hypothetical protein
MTTPTAMPSGLIPAILACSAAALAACALAPTFAEE